MKANLKESLKWWCGLSSEELTEVMSRRFLPHVLPHKLSNQQIKKIYNDFYAEPKFMCNSCHEHFNREEMDFDVDDDQDLCKNCNYQSYNDAPYGQD